MTTNTAIKFRNYANSIPDHRRDKALLVTRWLATRDPGGRGSLSDDRKAIVLTFTDGSFAVLDVPTQRIHIGQ